MQKGAGGAGDDTGEGSNQSRPRFIVEGDDDADVGKGTHIVVLTLASNGGMIEKVVSSCGLWWCGFVGGFSCLLGRY